MTPLTSRGSNASRWAVRLRDSSMNCSLLIRGCLSNRTERCYKLNWWYYYLWNPQRIGRQHIDRRTGFA